MSTMPMRPYRPQRLRATFETWLLRDEPKPIPITSDERRFATSSEPLVSEIPGIFKIEIRLSEQGRRSVYKAVVGETLQPFAKVFAESDLEGCKEFVKAQFKRQVTDWEEISA